MKYKYYYLSYKCDLYPIVIFIGFEERHYYNMRFTAHLLSAAGRFDDDCAELDYFVPLRRGRWPPKIFPEGNGTRSLQHQAARPPSQTKKRQSTMNAFSKVCAREHMEISSRRMGTNYYYNIHRTATTQ